MAFRLFTTKTKQKVCYFRAYECFTGPGVATLYSKTALSTNRRQKRRRRRRGVGSEQPISEYELDFACLYIGVKHDGDIEQQEYERFRGQGVKGDGAGEKSGPDGGGRIWR